MIRERKKLKKYDALLLLGVVIASVGIALSFLNKTTEKDKLYNIKIEAVEIMEVATKEIKKEKINLGILADTELDINQTGMIGSSFTGITTTIGSIEAKRTAATPDTAAVVVEMLYETGAKKGDTIAANFSGSFPGFNVAVMSACKAMQLNVIPIASIGASTFGANQPEFTYVDMHTMLYNKGVFTSPLVAFSKGGDYDIGKNMNADVLNIVMNRINEYNIPLIEERDFDKNVAIRMSIYENYGEIDVFINAGGNMVATSQDFFKEGVTLSGKAVTVKRHGLAEKFLIKNVPVINLLNVKNICANYNLPFDPLPIPKIGTSSVYYTTSYNELYAIISLVIIIFILCFYKKKRPGL